MSPIIAVLGATGTQGGSVTTILAKSQKWKVRGITRNPNSEAAKKLAAQGVDVVAADMDKLDSLATAFEGVTAVFAVTNFWETLMANGPDGAGNLETIQAKNVAVAASKTPSLKHFIWSTMPNAIKISKGAMPVPHWDYKARVDEYIKRDLPELAKKTTFLWIGMYPSNLAYFPMMKFLKLPFGQYAFLNPSQGDASVEVSGDIALNIGVWVQAILEHPEISLPARYAMVCTDSTTFDEMTKVWSKVTGAPAVYLDVPVSKFVDLWGPYGLELSQQFKYSEVYPNWAADLDGTLLSMEDLGIKKDQVRGLEQALEQVKLSLT